jgi:energy-coupling factor transporter ATP-binding protein EcfA2
MSGVRIQELILYNQMQITLLEDLDEYMGIILTPEMRASLIELFTNLRRQILNTPKILYSIRKKETIGRHVNLWLPNILNALIVGERGTGKSQYINRLKHIDFNRRNLITKDPEPHLIYQELSYPDRTLGCYFNFRVLTQIETNPNEQLFEHANVAFIFYQIDSLGTYRKIPQWIDKILSVVPNCKIFICASMIDRDRHFYVPDPYRNPFYVHRDIKYLQIPFSALSGRNFQFPIEKTLKHFESVGLIHATPTKL